MKISKFYEISRRFMKIMKFIEILDFCESGGSKTLIFLRNYWCFCNVMIFMKFHFFTEKFNFSVISIKFLKFCFFCENTCMSKTPIIPKEYQGFGASGLSKTQNFNKFHKFHVFS